jgi:hypothetical protein
MKNKPLPDAPLVEAADTEKALGFVRRLRELRGDDEAIKTYVNEFPLGTLQSIGRRIMMDILKGPQRAPEAKPAPEESAPATPRRRTARPGATDRRRPARER